MDVDAPARDPAPDRPRILVVEDDPSIASALVRGLKQARFEVELASTGEAAVQAAERAPVDLVLLDVNLPDMTGFDVLATWRARRSLPVIVLTARTELRDRLRAFDLGAADFISKPFWMEEVVARIRARLRLRDEQERRQIRFDGLVCDLDRRAVLRADRSELPLTSHEFNVLAFLLERAGMALTRAQLAEHTLPAEGDRQDRTVDSHISHLRKKLGASGARLRTVWGIGYRFDLEDGA